MRFKKPETVWMFKTTSGAPVETLDLWKQSELEHLLNPVWGGEVPTTIKAAKYLIEHAEAFVAILGIVERKGRPVGAKDKKPRKKATLTKTIQHSET